jgi:hypothetical protein
MGCRQSKEQVIGEILEIAQGRLTEQDIEEIMMNTQCDCPYTLNPFFSIVNENELLKLYKKFLELDKTSRVSKETTNMNPALPYSREFLPTKSFLICPSLSTVHSGSD